MDSTKSNLKNLFPEYILIESNAQPHLLTTKVYLDETKHINPTLQELFFPDLDLKALQLKVPMDIENKVYKTEDHTYSVYEVWGDRDLNRLSNLMEYGVYYNRVGQIEYAIKDYDENPPPFFTKKDKIFWGGFKHYRVRCVDSPEDLLVFDSKDPRFDIYFKDKSGPSPIASWLKSLTNNAGCKIWG